MEEDVLAEAYQKVDEAAKKIEAGDDPERVIRAALDTTVYGNKSDANLFWVACRVLEQLHVKGE